MAQHVGGDVEDVLRQHVVAAAHQRERAAGRDQPERGAGARAVGDPRGDVLHAVLPRRAGGHDQADDVVDERVVHEDLRGGLLQPAQLVGAEHRLGDRRLGAHPVDDLPLLLGARVVDEHLHEEAVALRLGQRVDALGLDRVLRGEHEERVGQRVGDAADGDLPLGHDLEQRRLHLGRRAVDLVGEHEVGEHRAELDVERVLAGLVDAGADDVGRHQVGGELQAGERAADGRGQGLDGQGLRHAGHALEQHVPRASRATSIRSTSRSWPTMTRLISNSTRSSRAASADGGTGVPAGEVSSGVPAAVLTTPLAGAVGCVPAQRCRRFARKLAHGAPWSCRPTARREATVDGAAGRPRASVLHRRRPAARGARRRPSPRLT